MRFIEFLKKVKSALTTKPDMSKEVYKSERVRVSVYGIDKEKNIAIWFRRFHYMFKYKFLVPLLYITKLLLGKKLDEPIETGKITVRKGLKTTTIDYDDFNKNLRIFDKSFDETVDDWVEKFLCIIYDKTPEKMSQCDSVELVRTLKKVVILGVRNDTAYREFLNILMHKIAQNMLKEYKGRKVDHFFYGSRNAYDLRYFNIISKLRRDLDGETRRK